MNETSRISDQIARAFEGDAWHGPSLSEILQDVDAKAAAAKPVPGAHSIWEIVLHLIGTQDLVLRRLQGDARNLTPDEDWPSVPEVSPEAWSDAVRKLGRKDEQLRKAVDTFEDVKLASPLIEGSYSAYVQFHGYVQHNLYHAGQIALLKKYA